MQTNLTREEAPAVTAMTREVTTRMRKTKAAKKRRRSHIKSQAVTATVLALK